MKGFWYWLAKVIDSFTVLSVFVLFCLFFNFDKDQLANIHCFCGKERLQIRKLTKLKNSYVKSERRYYSTKWQTFTGVGVGGGGGGTNLNPHHHTNVCKIWRLCGTISSLVFNKLHSNLASSFILRRSF